MPERHSYPLLSVEEALERVLASFRPLPAESVPLLESLGRVLADEVRAETDLPPHTNSAMDGFALRWQDTAAASPESPVRLTVVEGIAAGHAPRHRLAAGEAARIMTGAPLPPGADTVVRFEHTRCGPGWVELAQTPRRGADVRPAGEDVRRGEVAVSAGTVIRPQEVGMLAALGHSFASVRRRPRVAILATGDEVAELGEELAPGKIRNTNSFSNAAQALEAGAVPLLLGVARDRRDDLVAKLRQGIEAGVDLFVTSGGVSVGDFDLVKVVLAAEGHVDFWWVNMKPGRPLAFGGISGVPLLALPGNPVAAMISFDLFARPAILKMLGHTRLTRPHLSARLRLAVERKDGRRHYLRVSLSKTESGWEAELTGEQGSGILSSMVRADGLAIIPEHYGRLGAGSTVEVLPLRPLDGEG